MEDTEQLKQDWHNLVRASEAAMMNGPDRDAVRAGARRIADSLGINVPPKELEKE